MQASQLSMGGALFSYGTPSDYTKVLYHFCTVTEALYCTLYLATEVCQFGVTQSLYLGPEEDSGSAGRDEEVEGRVLPLQGIARRPGRVRGLLVTVPHYEHQTPHREVLQLADGHSPAALRAPHRDRGSSLDGVGLLQIVALSRLGKSRDHKEQ